MKYFMGMWHDNEYVDFAPTRDHGENKLLQKGVKILQILACQIGAMIKAQ